MNKDLISRLESITNFNLIPRPEIEWLVQHGNFEQYQPGLLLSKGMKIEYLWIILKGHASVNIDRGTGPKVVNTGLHIGTVTGMLPYSRLTQLPGDLYVDEETEVISISTECFPEMIQKCPLFTAHTVHTMIDRARIHNTSAMQDEKMISLGKMAAGLAHELNNPASVAIRDAKLIRDTQKDVDNAARILSKAGLNDEQFLEIYNIYSKFISRSQKTTLSPIQKSDLHDHICDWLEKNKIDSIYAGQLADLSVTTDDLYDLNQLLPKNLFETAIQWILARSNLDNLAIEIEQSTNQICKLVEAVKKFTHMDNLAERELVDIESGIVDALRLLDSKVKSKKVQIIIEIDKDLPEVYANGAELNQVWFSLLDNALDAVHNSGNIQICAGMETNFIVVRFINDGPGIPVEKRDMIFDPFYTTKPPGQGTGLGLNLSRRIIRNYNGDIYVNSKTDKTEFCINLKPGLNK